MSDNMYDNEDWFIILLCGAYLGIIITFIVISMIGGLSDCETQHCDTMEFEDMSCEQMEVCIDDFGEIRGDETIKIVEYAKRCG